MISHAVRSLAGGLAPPSPRRGVLHPVTPEPHIQRRNGGAREDTAVSDTTTPQRRRTQVEVLNAYSNTAVQIRALRDVLDNHIEAS